MNGPVSLLERTLHLNSATRLPPSLFQYARSRPVVIRAVRVALVVGVILIAINHGPALLRGEWSAGRLVQMATTFLVPYLVSTVSSAAALRDRETPS